MSKGIIFISVELMDISRLRLNNEELTLNVGTKQAG